MRPELYPARKAAVHKDCAQELLMPGMILKRSVSRVASAERGRIGLHSSGI